MNIRTRILQYLEYKTISKYQFYKEIGVSNGFLDKDGAIGSDKCEKICYQYPDINLYWLILGVGPMLKNEIIDDVSLEKNIPVIDNSSMSFILDRYEALAVENADLKKENAELKQSRGKPVETIPYTENLPKLSTSIAAEPARK
jgi:hypothetical protein